MKTFLIASLFLISTSLSMKVLAYPEIPFCPAGGPPGWMNYMDYKHDQNRWQRNNYTGQYPPINYARHNQYAPNYTPHLNGQNTTSSTYHTPYRSVETIGSRHYYNNFPNNYRNTTYAPRNYSGYVTPSR